jgi:hypothetical protein
LHKFAINPKEPMAIYRSIHSSWVSLLGILGITLVPRTVHVQVTLVQNQTPNTLVNAYLMGPGVSVSNVLYNGNTGAMVPSLYSYMGQIGRFAATNSCLGLNAGIFLCTNDAQSHIPGPNDVLLQNGGGVGGGNSQLTPDADLSQLSGWESGDSIDSYPIRSKSVLEFDFIPDNDMIQFRYVFSSEEYERWACSSYNDAFGFFISGPSFSGPFSNNAMNIAFVPGSLSPVSINTVNSGLLNANNANGPLGDPFAACFAADSNWQANAIYYRYNGGQWPYPIPPGGVSQMEAPYNSDPYYIQHNGMTTVLTASAAVQVGETYHIKLAIGNAMDNWYPSAVFLEQESFEASDRFTLSVDNSPQVLVSDTVITLVQSNTDSVYLRFNRWGGFYLDEHVQITVEGDAVAGEDYAPALPDSLHFIQLDSAVVLPMAVPLIGNGLRHFTVRIVTSNGDKVMTYHFQIMDPITAGMRPVQTGAAGLVLYPNPSQGLVEVVLTPEMAPRAKLRVRDAAGRVVREQIAQHTGRCTVDLGDLPNGVYTLEVKARGRLAAGKVQVRH